jgi:spermidine/putrescine-binding protein
LSFKVLKLLSYNCEIEVTCFAFNARLFFWPIPLPFFVPHELQLFLQHINLTVCLQEQKLVLGWWCSYVTPIYHTNCFTNFHSSRPIPVKRKVEDDDSERYKAFLVASTHITSHEEDYTFPSNNSMK